MTRLAFTPPPDESGARADQTRWEPNRGGGAEPVWLLVPERPQARRSFLLHAHGNQAQSPGSGQTDLPLRPDGPTVGAA